MCRITSICNRRKVFFFVCLHGKSFSLEYSNNHFLFLSLENFASKKFKLFLNLVSHFFFVLFVEYNFLIVEGGKHVSLSRTQNWKMRKENNKLFILYRDLWVNILFNIWMILLMLRLIIDIIIYIHTFYVIF